MTLKQALWEIVRDENIIITNQNIDWLLDRALKRASGDAQALKESILERKGVIEENISCALTNEEKISENGKLLLITENKSNNFDVKSNEELFKQALVEGLNRRFDREIEEAKQIEQIEGMSRDICPLNVPCEECTMLAKQMGQSKNQYCKPLQYAKRAYEKGWRKQSEGEWIKINPNNSLIGEYYCSCCNSVIDIADGKETPLDREMYYCPNCGAKMKEGTTQKYFTPSEVRKMSPKEVKENYDLIVQSMKRW